MKHLIIILLPLCLCQCASMEKSIGLGAGIGAVGGGATAQAINFNMKGIALTTATGALTGALIGYLTHKISDSREPAETPMSPLAVPSLNNPEAESIWVPDRIDGDRYEQGHWIHQIKKPAIWKMTDKEENENGRKRHKSEKELSTDSAE